MDVFLSLCKMKLVLCIIYLFASQVRGTPELSSDGAFQHHCEPKRQEVVIPTVTDSSGHTTSEIFSQTSPEDELYVTLRWRDQDVQIVLNKNTISLPTSVSEHQEGDVGAVEIIDKACNYQGYVVGQESSYVALSTCDGMAGYIQTDEEILFIEPQESAEDERAHFVYTCESPSHYSLETPDLVDDTTSRRRRRSSRPAKYVEIKVIVDPTVVKTVRTRSRATDYVMTLMNIANTAFQHNSLRQNIQLAVVKIVFISESQKREIFRYKNPGKTLSLFCKWSHKQRNTDFDVTLYLTEGDFGHSGFAPVGTMCQKPHNCLIVRDQGFPAGFIIAHELGHVFGLKHDGQKNTCTGPNYKKTIMSPVVVATFNHYWWSDCSRDKMAEMMTSLDCLDNTPTPIDNHYTLTAAQAFEEDLGISWSLDYQCSKDFGPDFKFCKSGRRDPCEELLCHSKKRLSCYTRYGNPLPGTNCGENKKCVNMTCVETGSDFGTNKNANSGGQGGAGPRGNTGSQTGSQVNGSWNAWSRWTTCNTKCGVGVRKRSRTCRDANRGAVCEGSAEAWEPCTDYSCKTYKDLRAEDCSKWKRIPKVQKWMPYENHNVSQKCQQTCQAYPATKVFSIEGKKVSDGAPCTYSQNTGDVCVDGQCKKVGCDGVLGSSKVFDACGTCDGDGSLCKTIEAAFEKDSPSVRRYFKVLRIPAGARQITVQKKSNPNSFMGLKDGRTGRYFLNGNIKSPKYSLINVVHLGAFFMYTHRQPKEMIKVTGPLRNPVDVMAYVNRREDLSISYEFTVSKDDDSFEKSKFKWKFEKWSSCSVTCGTGTKSTTFGCYDKDSNSEVDEKLCEVLRPPRVDSSRCSMPRCPISVSYQWKPTNDWTQCSASCDGSGTQSKVYQCQKKEGNKVTDVEDSFCDDVQLTAETKQCNGAPCTFEWETGDWSECSVTCGKGKQYRDVYCGDPESDADDAKCTNDPPASSKRCDLPFCPENDGSKCKDTFSFCSMYTGLKKRCQDDAFRRKCCKTCKRNQ